MQTDIAEDLYSSCSPFIQLYQLLKHWSFPISLINSSFPETHPSPPEHCYLPGHLATALGPMDIPTIQLIVACLQSWGLQDPASSPGAGFSLVDDCWTMSMSLQNINLVPISTIALIHKWWMKPRERMSNFVQGHTADNDLHLGLFNFQNHVQSWQSRVLVSKSGSDLWPWAGDFFISQRGNRVRMLLLTSLSLQSLKNTDTGKLSLSFCSGQIMKFSGQLQARDQTQLVNYSQSWLALLFSWNCWTSWDKPELQSW